MLYEYVKPAGTVELSKLQTELFASGLPIDSVNGGAIGSGYIAINTSRDLTTQEKQQLDTLIAAHDGRPRRIRSVFAIYQDLINPVKLSTTQQDIIIADMQLSSLTGKWTNLRPPQDAPAASFKWAATSLSGANASEKRQAAAWVVAMYCQQFPTYLVNPTFNATLANVNIPGDEVVS